MKQDLYRKVAMDRLSSPEQLDTLMKVTSPKGWIALAAIFLLLTVAVIWGITGRLSISVKGQGVLIKPGGIYEISTVSQGRVTDVRVAIHDEVKRGDVVARIDQSALLAQMEQVKQQLAVLREGESKDKAQNAVQVSRAALLDLLTQLETKYETESRVVSPYDGRVLEVGIRKGEQVDVGTPVLKMELQSKSMKQLEAVVYVPASEGKKMIPGMEVQISPTSINRLEYGFMLGRVVSISEFPSTMQSMMMTIGNEAYVQQLAAGGAALLETHIELIDDESTPSGYKWSTRQGPPMKIESGTPMIGEIILREQRPIAYVIPQFK